MSIKGFGTAKFGTGTTFTKTAKVVEGENVFRILPPMHSLAENGTWKVYYTTHWGYSGVNQRDTSKTIMRPFRCIKDVDRRNGLVRQDCPACTAYDELKAKRDAMEAKLKADGLSEDEVETAITPIEMQCRAKRAESKHYLNVMFKDGKVGEMKLNHADHVTRINALIEGTPASPGGLLKDGIHPFNPDQGVWFKITRVGKGVNPRDTVELEKEFIDFNGRKLESIKLAPLTDEQCDKALKECRDLASLGGLSLSYDQIAALVASSGDPEEVDRIIGVKPASKEQSAEVAKNETPKDVATAVTNHASAEQYLVNGKVVSKEQFDRYNTVLAKKKEEAEAKKKAEETARAEAAKATVAKARSDLQMQSVTKEDTVGTVDLMTASDEEFMASLGMS